MIRCSDCRFPDRCIKTNEPAASWRPVSLDFHILGITNRSYRFEVPLGTRWQHKRIRGKWSLTLILIGISMIVAFCGIVIADQSWAAVGIVAGVCVMVGGIMRWVGSLTTLSFVVILLAIRETLMRSNNKDQNS